MALFGRLKEASVYGKQLETTMSERKQLVEGLEDWKYNLYLLLLEGFGPGECARMLKKKKSLTEQGMLEIFQKLGVSTRAELIINYRGITGFNNETETKNNNRED